MKNKNLKEASALKWVTVQDVGEILTGTTPSKKDERNYGNFMPLIKPPDLKDGQIIDGQDHLSEFGTKSARILPENSVLVSCIGNIGKTGINIKPVAFNQQINAIIFNENVIPRFGLYYFQSSEAKQWLINHSSATTISIINKTKFSKTPFPVPPLEEQKKIVSKIEELFSHLDAGVVGLKRAQTALKRYRASVLKAAFEGRLVPQDRNDEPVEKLLNNKGVKVLDRNKYKPIPNSWGWTRLENCVVILDRQRKPVNSKVREKRIAGKNISDLYPYYGATGQVGWIDDFIFDEELVLLGEDGAPFLDTNKDKAYIVKGKFWVNNHAHVLRANCDLTTNRFILYYLNYFDFSNYVTGTTRLKLNQTKMKSIPIIIPPFDEQNRIVEEIDRRLSIISEIKKSIKVGFQNSDYLKSAILKSAFEGDLIK